MTFTFMQILGAGIVGAFIGAGIVAFFVIYSMESGRDLPDSVYIDAWEQYYKTTAINEAGRDAAVRMGSRWYHALCAAILAHEGEQ